jgi:hypothetical protein
MQHQQDQEKTVESAAIFKTKKQTQVRMKTSTSAKPTSQKIKKTVTSKQIINKSNITKVQNSI